MPTRYPSLSRENSLRIVESLDEALDLLANQTGPLTGAEVQLKSMLRTLQRELLAHAAELDVDRQRDSAPTSPQAAEEDIR